MLGGSFLLDTPIPPQETSGMGWGCPFITCHHPGDSVQRRWHQCPAAVGTQRRLSPAPGARHCLGRSSSGGSTRSHGTVPGEGAGGRGVPRENQGLWGVPGMAEMEKLGGVWEH